MSRLGIVLSGLIVLILVAIGAMWWWLDSQAGDSHGGVKEAERLNLILISLDTCRPDRLSYMEADRGTSPAIDLIAAESAVFTDCLSQSTSTGPAHRSAFTSQYVHRHGMSENEYWRSPYNMASLLQAKGYKTAAFTGGGYLRRSYGFDHGFDKFLGVTIPVPPEGSPKWRYMDEVLPQAEDWLEDNGQDPFFLLVHAYDPHCPYWPGESFKERFVSQYDGDLMPESLCGPSDFQPLIQSGKFGPAEAKYLNELYDASVASADQELAKFFRYLQDKELLDNSVIVFLSDHGESLGEHQWVGHIRMWEEQVRVPLFIRFPNGEHSGEYDYPAQLVDVLPTVLDVLGVQAPAGMQGENLMKTCIEESGEAAVERMRLCKFAGRESVRFDNRWKLSFRRASREIVDKELYDLLEDPGETRNLIDTADGKQRGEQILERYLAWRAKTAEQDKLYRGTREEIEIPAWQRRELDELGYTGDGSEDE